MDDTQYPVIEGLETFVVFLSSPQGAELTKPFQAIIAINDTFQDGKRLGIPAGGSDQISVISLTSTYITLELIHIFFFFFFHFFLLVGGLLLYNIVVVFAIH